MSRWSQFVALSLAQFADRYSLRDIVCNLSARTAKLYHLGSARVTRSSVALVKENQPYTLFEALIHKLLSRCQGVAPRHGFPFNKKLYSLDASTIDLCLSVFHWAEFRKKKGAIKLHVGLDHNGLIPAFMSITEGKCHDIQAARNIELPRDSILVVDRGYNDYECFNSLNKKGIFFVTRLKKNARHRVVKRKATHKKDGLTSNQEITLTSKKGCLYEGSLRRIGYICPETGRHYFSSPTT